MAQFSLKDHLFNPVTIGQLADEFAGLPGFDRAGFYAQVCGGLDGRELLQRLEWIADCLEPHLARDFPTMADQLETAMPPPLDPARQDDDFGQFIHAVPGILAVRHGVEQHRDRALDLIHAATQRFSMEFYIRPFLNRWPEETMARLALWARDDNYHVRRLVSEGTRPKLPWAKAIELDPMAPLPLLSQLHADPTRYVTRSVANHLNDIGKVDPDAVLRLLRQWYEAGQQTPKELGWMARHALRSLIKAGHPGAMAHLGYDPGARVTVEELGITPQSIEIHQAAQITCTLSAAKDTPVIVDYVIHFRKANGSLAPKVFKLKTTKIKSGGQLTLTKSHRFKGDATTFKLHPGAHRLEVQVNGRVLAGMPFDLKPFDAR